MFNQINAASVSQIELFIRPFTLPDMSKVQDDEVGDGTTSVTVLAAELLRVQALAPPPRLNTVVSDA